MNGGIIFKSLIKLNPPLIEMMSLMLIWLTMLMMIWLMMLIMILMNEIMKNEETYLTECKFK